MQNTKIKTFTGVLCLLFTITLWGTSFLATESLLETFSEIEILLFRVVLSFIGLFLLYPIPFLKKEWKFELLCFLASLFGVSLYQILENSAIKYTSGSNSAIIVACSCFFTAIFSSLILKSEKITVNFLIGFVFSMIGITLVSINGKIELKFNSIGDLFAFLSAILWGLYSVVISLINRYKYKTIHVTRRIMMYSSLTIIPIFFLTGGKLDFSKLALNNNWIWILFLGLLCSALCFITWNYSVSILGPVKTSLALYVQPLITIIIGVLFFNSKITLMEIVGSILVVTGLFISASKFIDKLIFKKRIKEKKRV